MRRVLLAPVLFALAWPSAAGAQAFAPSTDIQIAGGTAGVAEALGLAAPPRAVFLPELARHIYGVPEGKNEGTDKLLAILASYLEGVDRFDQALSAVQPSNGTISLALASDKSGRKRLNSFLDLLGLTLKEKSKKFSVETLKDKKVAERAPLLHRLGVDPADIARRLNAGESVRVEVKSELVPLPLDAATWSNTILEEKVPPTRLFARVMGDRKAALLAYGLAWLDDATLQYVAQTPKLLRQLYEDHAPVFAAYGRSVRVHDKKIAVPGGPTAEPLWERVVDEELARPDRFIRNLLARDDGRLAYFYDAIANLDAPHARFAFGLWIDDATLRAERFDALRAATISAFEPLRPKIWSFDRPPADLAIMLARVRVQQDGGPTAPNARKFWDRVFDNLDIPEEPAKELKDFQQDGAVDAAWLTEKTMTPARAADRAERLDTLVFGQRVFGSQPESSLPDMLVALRSFPRYRTLMLTLDRIGVTDAKVYAAAALGATSLSAVSRDRAFPVLAQFQSSLALLARLHAVRSLDDARAQRLVRDLIAVEPVEGEYRGAVAAWIDSVLAELPAATDATEEARMLRALAGVRENGDPLPTLTFEDTTYRVDLPGAELRRLTEIRRKQGGYDLSATLAFARAVRNLDGLDPKTATIADVRQAAEALKRTGAPFRADKVPPPPGVEQGPDPQQVIAKELKDLAKITKAKDVKKARESAPPLYELSDALLARTLLASAYALAIGDPGGTVLLGVDPSRRHDFGLLEKQDEIRRRAPWLLPVEQLQAGVPWHVFGSALALDVGLSRLGLRRVSGDKAAEHPQGINGNDQRTFIESLSLLDPVRLVDAHRDEIAAAIARGRARVAAAADAAALDALAADLHSLSVDGLRRRALRWTLANARDELATWLSMGELASLGAPGTKNLEPGTSNREPGTLDLPAWGMSGLVFDSCLCTNLRLDIPWQILAGQTSMGMVPANIADLNLRVAEISAEMKIPAVLARPILAAAVQSLLDSANPSDPDDWMTVVRAAQRITREDVEDYMAALTANGTLVPTESRTSPTPVTFGSDAAQGSSPACPRRGSPDQPSPRPRRPAVASAGAEGLRYETAAKRP